MKVLAIVPARGGSKGVPDKNIKMLGGKPLLLHTLEQAELATLISKVVVSTDSLRIAEITSNAGFAPPFIRPAELATDSAATIEVVKHVVSYFEQFGEHYDAVCLLQPTTPFRPNAFIDLAIKKFSASGADSLISVLPVPHQFNPHWTFKPDSDGFLNSATGDQDIVTRRQDLPQTFYRDGAIYLTRVSVIKNHSLYGQKITFIESDPRYHVNIDTAADWEKAEQLYVDLYLG